MPFRFMYASRHRLRAPELTPAIDTVVLLRPAGWRQRTPNLWCIWVIGARFKPLLGVNVLLLVAEFLTVRTLLTEGVCVPVSCKFPHDIAGIDTGSALRNNQPTVSANYTLH